MNGLRDIDSSLVSRSSNNILRVILYRAKRFNPFKNNRMLTAIIYIENMERFFQPIFWTYKNYRFHLFFFSFLFFLSACLFLLAWM